jgi:hypothetical protein
MLRDRRVFLTLLVGAVGSPIPTPVWAQAQGAQSRGMSRITAFAFHFAGLAGGDIQLAEYAGKPILVVNTASQCGYTPQYAGLQELWTRYRGRGLLIVGVPSNDFGGQEPGTAADIAQTAQHQYGRQLPDHGKGRGPRPQFPSVLQMGDRPAATRPAAVEFPQIPDRPRWADRRKFPVGHGADRCACHRSHRKAAEINLFVAARCGMVRNRGPFGPRAGSFDGHIAPMPAKTARSWSDPRQGAVQLQPRRPERRRPHQGHARGAAGRGVGRRLALTTEAMVAEVQRKQAVAPAMPGGGVDF